MTMHFDTLEYSNSLEQAGIARAHAEAIAKPQAKALSELIAHELVTKEFQEAQLHQLRTDIKAEMQLYRAELKNEMQGTRAEQKNEMQALKSEIKNDLQGAKSDLKSEFKLDLAQLEVKLREEIRREGDALRLQLRSLQYGGAIAAFAVSMVVLLTRIVK